MAIKVATLVLLCFVAGALARESGKFPEGPSQQCEDDAGPPWVDDGEKAYYVGFPNTPVMRPDGSCPTPLKAACDSKGPLAAHLDGPVDCGGRGWFCRLNDQPGHRMPGMKGGKFPDSNYASCNQKDTEHDRDGHCHGSDVDQVYGWWVRDHWHRNYAGKLKCCCGWEEALTGVVNRCDYRKPIKPSELSKCRDANEEHNVDMHPNCTPEQFANYKEPPADQCWEVTSFGPGPYRKNPGIKQPPYAPPADGVDDNNNGVESSPPDNNANDDNDDIESSPPDNNDDEDEDEDGDDDETTPEDTSEDSCQWLSSKRLCRRMGRDRKCGWGRCKWDRKTKTCGGSSSCALLTSKEICKKEPKFCRTKHGRK